MIDRYGAERHKSRKSQISRRAQSKQVRFERLEPRIVLDASMNPVLTVQTNFGSFEMELLWQESPIAVNNFLDYVNDGDYTDSIFHRLADISSGNDDGNNGIDVLQGGGFTTTDEFFTSLAQIGIVPAEDPITGEPGILNERGTVALALSGGSDTGTNQFYVNVQDNLFLTQFTVFARISDMTLIDQFSEFNISDETPGPGEEVDPLIDISFGELPLSDQNELIVVESITGDGMLHGFKYDDLDRDGQRDGDEPGLAGFTIYLDENGNGEFDEGDEVSTVTDENGEYCFVVSPGDYVVREVPADNREVTQPLDAFYDVTIDIGRVVSDLDFGSNNQTNAPTLDVTADAEADQLATFELLASFFDEDFVDIHELQIDWGDGTVDSQVVTAANSSNGTAGDLTIRLDYSRDTENFFNTAAKRELMQQAADIIAALYADELTAILSDGGNSLDIVFNNPADGTETTLFDFSVEENELVVFVGGRDLGSTGDGDVDVDLLGVGGPGGFEAAGDQAFVDNASTRGQAGAAETNDPRTDFGPWGGSIAFNSSTNWHFGITTEGLEEDEVDFLSVALHELAHLFGAGSAASWDALVDDVLDLFGGAQVAAEIDNGADPALTADGNHFAEGLRDEGREVALDPTLSSGVRKLLTNLDVAALGDIGWETDNVGPSGGDVTASHIYNSTGIFDITVRVTDSDGNVAEQVVNVNVGDAVIGTGDPELLIVTTLADTVAVDGVISLREALLATNADTTVSDAIAGPSTTLIQFDPSLFDSPGVIALTDGDLRITDSIEIVGPGSEQLTIDAGFVSRGFRIKDSTSTVLDVALSGMTITNGQQPDSGGAIFNQESLTLDDVRLLASNHGDLPGVTRGGAIFTAGDLTINNSTIDGNSAMFGGGIFVDSGAIVEINNSTLSNNHATRHGGGLYVNNGSLSLINTTISGNIATLDGGGIYQNSIEIETTNVTIANNEAENGGGIYSEFGTIAAVNTIIAGNSATTAAPDAMTTINGNNNLLQDASVATLNGDDNQSGVDPLLSELGDFGGSTFTHFLRGGSPAIDAGTDVDAPLVDQRGAARPVDGDGIDLVRHDIGAVEVSTFALGESYVMLQGEDLDVDAAAGVLANDVLPVGDAEVIDGPAVGDLLLATDGSFTYMPPSDFFGEVSFTYAFVDGDLMSNTATVTITINESMPPEIALGGSSGEESEADDQAFTWDVTDPDNGLFSVEVTVRQDDAIVFTSSDAAGSFEFDDLGTGGFTIEVDARDVTNKQATATREVIVAAAPLEALSLTLTTEEVEEDTEPVEQEEPPVDLPEIEPPVVEPVEDAPPVTSTVETTEPVEDTAEPTEDPAEPIEEEQEQEEQSDPPVQQAVYVPEESCEEGEHDDPYEQDPTDDDPELPLIETEQQTVAELENLELFSQRLTTVIETELLDEDPLLESVVLLGDTATQLLTPEPLTGSGGDVQNGSSADQADSDAIQDENVAPASAEEPVDEGATDGMSLLDRAFSEDLLLDFYGLPLTYPEPAPVRFTAEIDRAPTLQLEVAEIVASTIDAPTIELVEQAEPVLLAEPSQPILLAVPVVEQATESHAADQPVGELNVMRLVESSRAVSASPFAAAMLALGWGAARSSRSRRNRSRLLSASQ